MIQKNKMKNIKENCDFKIFLQIPGFKGVQDKTKSTFSPIKLCCHSLIKKFAIDEQHFPKRTTRFTAIYSRDKEYLYV